MVRDISELSVETLKGVGPKRAALLGRLGIKTVADAVFHMPSRYEDRGRIKKISELSPGNTASVSGKVVSKKLINTRRGRFTVFELAVSDGSGIIKAKWFNQPFLKDRFGKGQEVVLSGQVRANPFSPGIEIENPLYDSPVSSRASGIIPIYRSTEGISSKQLREIVNSALDEHIGDIADPLPKELLERNGLPGLREAISYCHRPSEGTDVEVLNSWGSPYQRRLSFDELFFLEIGLLSVKKKCETLKGTAMKSKGRLTGGLLEKLPFSLTASQKRVFEEIKKDMGLPRPMNRLIQGDVGSGKTLVALMTMLECVECGHQAALMAPTEILAEQHYANITGMAGPLGVKVCLITGSSKERPLKELRGGGVEIAVGTHALIQEAVGFGRLGLVVIDEQHRFGVMQRALLRQKADSCPDVLVMTATPIPRTLALTAYGDLSISVIDELPPGRMPVETIVLNEGKRREIHDVMASELSEGGQIYVVYPAIEGEEGAAFDSAVSGCKAAERSFPGAKVALLHGRMPRREQGAVLSAFRAGSVEIVVSTTVIEVGVDVPNASLMVLRHADRFGLSQIHQLRGRVGRGERPSRCLLVASGRAGPEALKRLEIIASTSDGFRVSEEDLRLRGPGEVLGTRQAGMPDFRFADIIRDFGLVEAARREAGDLLEASGDLGGHPFIRAGAERFWAGRLEVFKTG